MTNKRFSFLDIFVPTFCVLLVTSNIVAQKFFDFAFMGINWSMDVGTLLLFPILYVAGDILSEVYGYATTRRVIWTAFALQIIAALVFTLAVAMPSSEFFDAKDAFARILGAVPALVVASLIGYWCGSFANSLIMVKMKEWMVKWDPNHKFLPLRTVTSTFVGEFVDTVLFVGIGTIFGVFPAEIFVMLTLTQWLLKTGVEVVMTPFTILLIKAVKKYEEMDVVGIEADDTYSPFKKLFAKKAK